jgi:exonuclease III
MSINVGGVMLAMPVPNLPTALQTILHGPSHTNTDFIFLQDTRVTAEQASWFEYLCRPWAVFQSPSPTNTTGGCAIITRGHWAQRDYGVALFPDGRGIHIEVRGHGMHYLALLNLYCWPGAADETPAVRLSPQSAYKKNQDLFECCADVLSTAVAHNRFLVLGGDMNMVLHAARDRASPSNGGDLCAQDLLRDFTAKLRVAPPRLEPRIADDPHRPWPATFRVGGPQATRLDYLMLPTFHASASRGVATWTARSVHSDHSVIMLTFCRDATLGKLRESDRQHRPAGTVTQHHSIPHR